MTTAATLIDVYDSYGDLSVDRYFTIKYDRIATTAEVGIPLKPQKESIDLILKELDVEGRDFEVVYKEWKVAKHSEVKSGDDFIKYMLLSSTSLNICIEIEAYHETVSIEFFYDQEASGVEEWVFKQLDWLRTKFGKPETPVFRILSKNKGEFRTRMVDIDYADIDLQKNYNDDLLEVDEIIRESIEQQESGLILLHGIPGTGKTSYIKTLLTRYMDEKFIFIPNDFVDEMLKPDFITFLIGQKNSILVIEDAESVIMAREQKSSKSVVSTILQITDGLFSDYLNIKVVCTFNTDVSKIDKALFRKGRMIAFYKFEELAKEKALALLGVDDPSALPETCTLSELYNHKARSFKEATTKRRIGFGK
jgi:SpoVK/Ycf46/Vps4 family AAA+-type ATPase